MTKTFLKVASTAAGLIAAMLVPVGYAFAADQLTISSYGGVYQASLRKAVLEPFSKASEVVITQMGTDRSKLQDADKSTCGAPYVTSAMLIGYDKSKLPTGPKTIADFFDLQKFPGKRGLKRSPDKALEWALMADGVRVKESTRC
ncbi:extracellular solute-binding protein [Bradyrhizobium vignae]|uniref:extracellular solute-binding protein n=1 Tax=Bradyrhizobium vignae TaxID=1549949 RepID=UPI0024C03AAE|nr:extracellular solute-binding protein [Bradyrhizobium vignae]